MVPSLSRFAPSPSSERRTGIVPRAFRGRQYWPLQPLYFEGFPRACVSATVVTGSAGVQADANDGSDRELRRQPFRGRGRGEHGGRNEVRSRNRPPRSGRSGASDSDPDPPLARATPRDGDRGDSDRARVGSAGPRRMAGRAAVTGYVLETQPRRHSGRCGRLVADDRGCRGTSGTGSRLADPWSKGAVSR